MTLLSGRNFTEQDAKLRPRRGKPTIHPADRAIIDEEFAKRYWPDEDP
jgi:hypothetical protein